MTFGVGGEGVDLVLELAECIKGPLQWFNGPYRSVSKTPYLPLSFSIASHLKSRSLHHTRSADTIHHALHHHISSRLCDFSHGCGHRSHTQQLN
jgi:hypothetical protein